MHFLCVFFFSFFIGIIYAKNYSQKNILAGKKKSIKSIEFERKIYSFESFSKKISSHFFILQLFFSCPILLIFRKRRIKNKKKKLRFQLCLTVVLPANKNRKYLFAVRKSYANECRPIPSKAKRSSTSKSSSHQRSTELYVEETTRKNLIFRTSVAEHTHTHIYIENSNMLDKIIRYKKFLRKVTGGIFSSLSSIPTSSMILDNHGKL